MPKDIQVAIFAGGMATRLGELTKDIPKSMMKINGKPFIEYQMERLKEQGITDIIICSGHLGEQIERYIGDGKKYGLNVRYSHEDTPLGTAGALKKAEKLLDDAFITMYGDSYLFLDYKSMFSYFLGRGKSAMMTVYKNYDRHERSNTSINDDMVTGYSKNGRTNDMVYVDYGAHIFRREVLEMIPGNRYFPLEELFPVLIARQQLLAFEVRERFYEIGSIQSIAEFSEYIRGKS
jgi:NDP-sugar pyrophosphorylase family protein